MPNSLFQLLSSFLRFFSSLLICFLPCWYVLLWYSPSRWELVLCTFTMLILLSKAFNCWPLRAFVNKSANCECVGVKNSLMTLSCTLFLTNWLSTSMRFVLSWKIGSNQCKWLLDCHKTELQALDDLLPNLLTKPISKSSHI